MLHQTWNTENKNRDAINKLRNHTRSKLYICVPLLMLSHRVATFRTTKSWWQALITRWSLQFILFLEPCCTFTIRYFKQLYAANHGLHVFFFGLQFAYFNSMCKAVIEVLSSPMQPPFDMSPEDCSPAFPLCSYHSVCSRLFFEPPYFSHGQNFIPY